MRETEGEVVAFSDANARWAPDALRQLVAGLADSEVAYVCGRLRLEDASGSNREGLYWRYELWLREQESRLGSVTGGNGSIYALRRECYVEVDPKWGHDLAFPYRMVQAGKRAVYEPEALAFEQPTPTNETEYARKVRMFEHCWEITLRGSMLRRLPPGYLVAMVSHRVLRYGSGVLHLALLATSVALAPAGWPYALVLLGQLALLAAFVARVPLARYYVYVTWATAQALWNYLRRGRARRLGSRCDAVNRAADIALAGLGLAVTSPLLAAAAVAIKLEDGGPILYRQTRVGQDGRDFEVLKLRSMVVGAERQGAGYAVDRGDSRITRVGRLRPPDLDRRAPAALERRPGRHVRDRPSPHAPVPGRAVRRAAAPEARRAAGPDRLGAGARARQPPVGRSDRARRLVRRAPLGARRPEDPRPDAARAPRRHLQGRDGRLALSAFDCAAGGVLVSCGARTGFAPEHGASSDATA